MSSSRIAHAAVVPASECLDPAVIAIAQARRLAQLISAIDGRNQFFSRKLRSAGVTARDVQDLSTCAALPLTTKAELVADQESHGPWGTALTEPIDRYTRYCQTSSTTGRPIRWLDTNESWQWVLECWKAVYRAAGVGPPIGSSFRFRSGRSLDSGPVLKRVRRLART